MIISILIGMAAIVYDKTVKHAREAVLKQDLQTMRQAIDNYTLDKQQAPQSLQDLVDAHYLREVPLDPVCHAKRLGSAHRRYRVEPGPDQQRRG